jgi:hypothetical protein
MGFISNSIRALVGLFVDDQSLAVATIVILGTVGAARHAGLVGSTGAAVLLCGAIAVALLENVSRSARTIGRQTSAHKS